MKAKYLIFTTLPMFTASCQSQQDYDAQGTFEATSVTVSAEATGKILSLDLEQGDSVAAGQVVGVIDTTQLALQRQELMRQRQALASSQPDMSAQIASLQEQIAGATVERDRIARLLERGAATRQQLDNLNTRLASLKGQLEAQKSSISNSAATLRDQAEAVNVKIEAVNNQIANALVSSPISGTVLTKIAEPGEVASFGKPLFTVADMENVYLRAYFTSDQLASLRLGQKVRVVADYGAGNQRDYEGVVSFISQQSEFTPKTIQTRDSRANLVYAVKIAVKNDGLLKIGLTGYVYVGDSGK